MDEDVLAGEERRLVDGEDDSGAASRRWCDGVLGRHVSAGGGEAHCNESRPEAGWWRHAAQTQYEPRSMVGHGRTVCFAVQSLIHSNRHILNDDCPRKTPKYLPFASTLRIERPAPRIREGDCGGCEALSRARDIAAGRRAGHLAMSSSQSDVPPQATRVWAGFEIARNVTLRGGDSCPVIVSA